MSTADSPRPSPAGEDGGAVVVLDLRGLKCPLPALRTRKALRRMPAGGRLAVTCTDPLARLDIPHAAAVEGAVLEGRSENGDALTFLLRKA